MDLLVEKGDSRTYLSRYKVITTSFEESSPSVKRNNTQIQYRNGNVDFGGWHGSKKIDYVGYYRADDIDEEETLREKIYALLSDPDGYYITQLKNDSDNSYERPGENTGDYFEKQVNRPSHKRFYVYASSLDSELVGSYGGHVLYKIIATFTTMKLPYGESVPRDLDVKPDVPYYGRNLLTGTSNDIKSATGGGWLTKTIGRLSYDNGRQYTASVKIERNDYPMLFQIWKADANGIRKAFITGDVVTGLGRKLITFTAPEENDDETIIMQLLWANGDVSGSYAWTQAKAEKGRATPWSPAPEDPEYNKWYLDTYYNTNNLVIPYAGTVPCNQLEQGFAVEFTAKESGSGLKVDLNGTELTYNGQLSSGDVLKLSGYEYTKNDISIVKSTNKAYFKLLPGVTNKISSNLHGSIRILNFQNLYV